MSALRPAVTGAVLTAVYTLTISGADGITKHIAGSFAAPQLFCLSAGIVLALTLVASRTRFGLPGTDRAQGGSGRLSTSCPRAMAIRSVLTVLACIGFFQAFRLLPFADVFLFIGLMPIIAALLSGPVLGETIRPQAWAALGLGTLGVVCLMPGGLSGLQPGHFWALMAALTGTGSMVAARYIGRVETNALAQVFYPNLAILLVMGIALPVVWQPMAMADLGWVATYATCLFFARWVVVVALRLLPAYVATPLMNLQFVWMVVIGFLAFGEVPGSGTLLGVVLVITSGLWLVADELMPRRRAVLAV